MKRTKRVAVVAHCLLNANTKVHGLANYESVHDEAIRLIQQGFALVQLPCPEATYLGMRRWGMTKEQYDNVGYRRHCREILSVVVDTIEELVADGCEVAEVVGVDGSPTCAASRTCAGWEGGELGEGVVPPPAHSVAGRGVLMEQLAAMLAERGLEVPIRGIDE